MWQAQQAAEHEALFARLAAGTGLAVDMDSAVSVRDLLFCYRSHNYSSFPVADADFDSLTTLVQWIYAQYSARNTHTHTQCHTTQHDTRHTTHPHGTVRCGGRYMVPQVVRLQISAWLSELAQLLAAAAAPNPPPLKLAHFSAHDTTVMPALAALGLWDGNLMPYAAHLVLELARDTDNHTHVSFFFGGADSAALDSPLAVALTRPRPHTRSEDVTMGVAGGRGGQVPWCEGRAQCPLEAVLGYLAAWNASQLNEWCGGPAPEPNRPQPSAALTLGLGFTVDRNHTTPHTPRTTHHTPHTTHHTPHTTPQLWGCLRRWWPCCSARSTCC